MTYKTIMVCLNEVDQVSGCWFAIEIADHQGTHSRAVRHPAVRSAIVTIDVSAKFSTIEFFKPCAVSDSFGATPIGLRADRPREWRDAAGCGRGHRTSWPQSYHRQPGRSSDSFGVERFRRAPRHGAWASAPARSKCDDFQNPSWQVLIGWNGTREAAERPSMPYLCCNKQVHHHLG